MIYYQHTTFTPQPNKAFLNVAIKKSILSLPWTAKEIFQYLKHYLPALQDVNPLQLMHGKNGHMS